MNIYGEVTTEKISKNDIKNIQNNKDYLKLRNTYEKQMQKDVEIQREQQQKLEALKNL
jgi:hypothetical protein